MTILAVFFKGLLGFGVGLGVDGAGDLLAKPHLSQVSPKGHEADADSKFLMDGGSEFFQRPVHGLPPRILGVRKPLRDVLTVLLVQLGGDVPFGPVVEALDPFLCKTMDPPPDGIAGYAEELGQVGNGVLGGLANDE